MIARDKNECEWAALKNGESVNTVRERCAAQLTPETRKVYQQKLKQEAQRKQREAQLEAQQKQKEDQELTAWRKTLKIGDDTHCGPVIEVRGPMVKVAVNAPLPGYASEAWLKQGEVYPPQHGCVNRNGRLSPNT